MMLSNTANQQLPPLPESEELGMDFDKGWDGVKAYGYTADQMQAYARAALEQRSCDSVQGVPADLTPLAKRRIFDAIRAAYDLGWSDRQNGTHAAREVEADHGAALISGLAAIAYLATPAPPQAQQESQLRCSEPLTDEQINQLDWHLSAERDYEPHSGQERLIVAGTLDFARAVEKACAEAWGVKLAGIGASSSVAGVPAPKDYD